MKLSRSRVPVAHEAPLQDVRPSLEMTFRGHRQAVLGVDMEPTPFNASSLSSHALPPKTVSCGADGSVLLWDCKATTRALRFVGHRGPVTGCAISPNALLIASCGQDGYVRLWVPDLRRASSSFPGTRMLTQGVAPASHSARTGLVSSATSADTDSSDAFKAHSNGAARALAFAKDGSDVLYTVGDDKGVKAWDLNGSTGSASSGRFLGSFLGGHTNWVRCVAVQSSAVAASQTAYLATGGDDAAVLLWDTRTRQVAHRFSEHDGGVRSIAFHPGGYQVASGDANGAINVYDVRRTSSSSSSLVGGGTYGLIQHYRRAHGSTGSAVNGLDFCPKGHWLLSAGDDAVVKLWDTLEGYLYCAMEAHAGPVRACRFSTDGTFFTTGGADKVVMVWRAGLPGRCVPAAPRPTTEAVTQPAVVATTTMSAPSSRTPLLSTSMEAARARLEKAHYAPRAVTSGGGTADESHVDAYAEEEEEAQVPADASCQQGSSSRDRSFERDEARCSRIGTTTTTTQVEAPPSSQVAAAEPSKVFSAAGSGANNQSRRVRFSEDVHTSSPAGVDTTDHELPARGQAERIENLERAVAMLGQQVRGELFTQRREAQALRDEWEQSQVQHREEMQKLMTMMAQLVQQQTILVAQQQQQHQQNDPK